MVDTRCVRDEYTRNPNPNPHPMRGTLTRTLPSRPNLGKVVSSIDRFNVKNTHPLHSSKSPTSMLSLPLTPATASPPKSAARASSKTVAPALGDDIDPAPAHAPPPPPSAAGPPPPLCDHPPAAPHPLPPPPRGPSATPAPLPLLPLTVSKPFVAPQAGLEDDAPSPLPLLLWFVWAGAIGGSRSS